MDLDLPEPRVPEIKLCLAVRHVPCDPARDSTDVQASTSQPSPAACLLPLAPAQMRPYVAVKGWGLKGWRGTKIESSL